jgi:eukaryotic-like serine/threonine-protein kinase
MKHNQIIEFIRKKDFKFIKEIGNGAFGETVLLKDEYLDIDFVCKKYKPIDGVQKEAYFENFVHEIKLLHLLYHRNIVRVFNYYLYPEYFTGYIMMESIDGESIDIYLKKYPENFNSIFEQTIKGFTYLEENHILHRDIRPANILVDNNHNVKIIDFGFGKKIAFSHDNEKSISINWWTDEEPDEFRQQIYDFQTEIFFIGKLFQRLLSANDISFKYKAILKKMVALSPTERITTFQAIQNEMSEYQTIQHLFNDNEKYIYKQFAYQFSNALSEREVAAKISLDIDEIIQKFDLLQKRTLLEDQVHPVHVLRCLIKGSYKYYSNMREYFSIEDLTEFINWFKNTTVEKKNIILYNLSTRFEDKKTYTEFFEDEIPF